jgi:hypothetical protein
MRVLPPVEQGDLFHAVVEKLCPVPVDVCFHAVKYMKCSVGFRVGFGSAANSKFELWVQASIGIVGYGT